MEQSPGLLALLRTVRSRTGLSLLLFSGFTRRQIGELPHGSAILGCLDVLVDGPYEAAHALRRGLRGSDNQRIHLLTGRYTGADMARVPAAEVRISSDGSVTVTGVSPPEG